MTTCPECGFRLWRRWEKHTVEVHASFVDPRAVAAEVKRQLGRKDETGEEE